MTTPDDKTPFKLEQIELSADETTSLIRVAAFWAARLEAIGQPIPPDPLRCLLNMGHTIMLGHIAEDQLAEAENETKH